MLGSPPGSRLDAAARAAALERLGDGRLDLLVVGGGVTGAGIALDAATRGLSVAVVEQHDFASGTSSRSSKLIHGGLRYLEQLDLALVSEALRERALLLGRLAPHLVRSVPFLLPLHSRWERGYYGAGLALYDTLGGLRRQVPRHRHLGRRSTVAAAPGLRHEGLVGAIRYFDAQTDDARFALMLLRTALAHGASAVSGAAVTGFLGDGRIEGVRLEDAETGAGLDVRARVTVLAGGHWSAGLEALAGVERPLAMHPSKGVHVLVPRDRIELDDALIVRTERSVLLVMPWGGHWLVGTTDTPFDGDEPTATAEDVDYLFERLNAVVRTPVGREDVTGAFAGVRPLVHDGSADTARTSRSHVVRCALPGLVTVAGGKYTTYRVMAADAVDAAAGRLGAPVDRSRTDGVPLLGAAGLASARDELARAGLDERDARRLLGRYGALAPEVWAPAADEPALAERLPGTPYLAAEAVYAVTHEGALHLDDVLVRRTHVAIEAADRGRAAAPVVAELLAGLLGWSPAQQHDEVARYERRLDAEWTPARRVAGAAAA